MNFVQDYPGEPTPER